MSRPRPLTMMAAAIGLAAAGLTAEPAVAQAGHYGHYNRGYDQGWRTPSWWDQRDRPGDYRCDAYWDANRTDCHERWRHQRPRTPTIAAIAIRAMGVTVTAGDRGTHSAMIISATPLRCAAPMCGRAPMGGRIWSIPAEARVTQADAIPAASTGAARTTAHTIRPPAITAPTAGGGFIAADKHKPLMTQGFGERCSPSNERIRPS